MLGQLQLELQFIAVQNMDRSSSEEQTPQAEIAYSISWKVTSLTKSSQHWFFKSLFIPGWTLDQFDLFKVPNSNTGLPSCTLDPGKITRIRFERISWSFIFWGRRWEKKPFPLPRLPRQAGMSPPPRRPWTSATHQARGLGSPEEISMLHLSCLCV